MAKQTIKLGEIVKSVVQKVNANFTELYKAYDMIPNKVDKEAGKGLSENDYTTAEKQKLAGIDANAQVNVLEFVKVNGTALPNTAKSVNIDLSRYALKTDVTALYKYKGSKANEASLPSSGNVVGDVWNTEDTGMNYVWTGAAWDALGATVDLSAYATVAALNAALANKVDKVTGKGLSTNDYTNDDKAKLAKLSAPSKHTFLAAGWGNAVSGYYTMEIPVSGKYPLRVMRKNSASYEEALVQVAMSGTNVVLTSEEAFEGYVVLA